jgi:hypothetical protein
MSVAIATFAPQSKAIEMMAADWPHGREAVFENKHKHLII